MAYRVLITGASSGIGRGLAVALAHNNSLLIHGQNAARLQETADLCQPTAAELRQSHGDLTLGHNSLLAEFAQLSGDGPMIVIQNAGVFFPQPLAEQSTAVLEQTLRLNLLAPIALTHSLWPELCQFGGKLILISSIAAHETYVGSTVYGASKAGLSHFGRTLALEAPPHVSVHVFEPGPIDTPLWQRQSFRPDGMRSVDDLVQQILTDAGLTYS